MASRLLRSVLTALLVPAAAFAAEPHPQASKVAPGATVRLEFPALPPDRHGQVAACEVRIPAGYDPARKLPLVAWLAGGEGGTSPAAGFLPPGDFVLVGLPYPKGAANPAQPNMVGDFGKVWAYHRAMLEDVHRLLPNLDRRSSILAGFSNGGHAIDGMLRTRNGPAPTDGIPTNSVLIQGARLPKPPYSDPDSADGARPAKVTLIQGSLGFTVSDFFGILIAADGGGTSYTSIGQMHAMKGRYAYVCWGEKSPNRRNGESFARALKSKGATVEASEMKGVGHAFPESEQAKIKEWLAKVAIPGCAGGK